MKPLQSAPAGANEAFYWLEKGKTITREGAVWHIELNKTRVMLMQRDVEELKTKGLVVERGDTLELSERAKEALK